MSGRRTTRAVLGLLLATSLAACAGDTPQDQPSEAPTSTGPTLSVAPLTGEPVEEGSSLEHPAVAVKVSDVPEAHPQEGVDRADIVFVEPVGPSYTRLAAVFHSDLPESVGPVRSVRPMDAALLGPLDAVFGNTMGAGWVVEYVDEVADLDNLGSLRVRGSGAYRQDADRAAPDHVLADPEVLLELSDRTDPPSPYFRHATDVGGASAASGTAATALVVPYGPEWEVTWTYDEPSGSYLRQQPWGPHVTADGTTVGAANVLVLSVTSVVEKLGEGAGAPVPVLQLVEGSGDLLALAGGRVVRGTWSKGAVNEPFELRTASGDELLLAPGVTWVELPVPSADVTVG